MLASAKRRPVRLKALDVPDAFPAVAVIVALGLLLYAGGGPLRPALATFAIGTAIVVAALWLRGWMSRHRARRRAEAAHAAVLHGAASRLRTVTGDHELAVALDVFDRRRARPPALGRRKRAGDRRRNAPHGRPGRGGGRRRRGGRRHRRSAARPRLASRRQVHARHRRGHHGPGRGSGRRTARRLRGRPRPRARPSRGSRGPRLRGPGRSSSCPRARQPEVDRVGPEPGRDGARAGSTCASRAPCSACRRARSRSCP